MSEDTLQIAEERREGKNKGERTRHTQLNAGQKATVRTGHGKMDGFQIGKGVHKGCILSPCLFYFYAEYIMQNARLDEGQAEIKIAGRNINNFRYPDDTTLMEESEEELKVLSTQVPAVK